MEILSPTPTFESKFCMPNYEKENNIESSTNKANPKTNFSKFQIYEDPILNKEILNYFICPICSSIIKNPKQCSNLNCQIAFCDQCLTQYSSCPICKTKIQNFPNLHFILKKILNNLEIQCQNCLQIGKYKNFRNFHNCLKTQLKNFDESIDEIDLNSSCILNKIDNIDNLLNSVKENFKEIYKNNSPKYKNNNNCNTKKSNYKKNEFLFKNESSPNKNEFILDNLMIRENLETPPLSKTKKLISNLCKNMNNDSQVLTTKNISNLEYNYSPGNKSPYDLIESIQKLSSDIKNEEENYNYTRFFFNENHNNYETKNDFKSGEENVNTSFDYRSGYKIKPNQFFQIKLFDKPNKPENHE